MTSSHALDGNAECARVIFIVGTSPAYRPDGFTAIGKTADKLSSIPMDRVKRSHAREETRMNAQAPAS